MVCLKIKFEQKQASNLNFTHINPFCSLNQLTRIELNDAGSLNGINRILSRKKKPQILHIFEAAARWSVTLAPSIDTIFDSSLRRLIEIELD